MRAAALVVAIACLGAPASARTACSILDGRPCAPSVCSVFDSEPCRPEYGHPIGQDLRLTVQGRGADRQGRKPERPLNTIEDVFAALRGCWTPPPAAEARPGMEISVRLSFTRSGEIMGEPRFTFVTPGTSSAHRATYQRAVAAALNLCTPLPFTDGLGGALAGRPISIRFIDTRNQRGAGATP